MEKKYIVAIFIIALVIFNVAFFYKKTCKTEDCFNKALKGCEPAKYYGYRNNNLYLYKISRSLGECRLYIRVEGMAEGTEADLVRLLEDNDMKCKIPRDVTITLDKMENLLDYCHGTLKEGLYQIMLERIYTLLVRDMSGIIEEAEKVMKV